MVLIKCPECEHVISDKADFCTHCGYSRKLNGPENQTKQVHVEAKSDVMNGVRIGVGMFIVLPLKIALILVVMFVIFGIFGSFFVILFGILSSS